VFQRDKGMALSKRDKASRKKRDKIIQTTINLLLKKGSLTSTTDICAAAKITRPTLYHYFGSKRNLLFSVHMESIERDLKPLLAEAAATSDPLKRLTYMIRTHVRNICLHPELRVIIHDTLTTRDKYFREVKEEWKKHYTLLRNTIKELQSKGIISTSIKPSLAALLVLGMTTWVTYWFDYGRKKEDIDKVTDAALQQALNGLGLKSPPVLS
jgi:TetR/AcrR family transcriptional regulator, cholesterol catabolism regulator